MKIIIIIAVIGFVMPMLFADTGINISKHVTYNDKVVIENAAGYVKVTGWAEDKLSVTGSYGPGIDNIEIVEDGDTIRIKTKYKQDRNGIPIDFNAPGMKGMIEIKINDNSSVDVTTVSAGIDIIKMKNDIKAESTSGEIDIKGSLAEINAKNTEGDIEISGNAKKLSVVTVSGMLRLNGDFKDVKAVTVNGKIFFEGNNSENMTFNTTTGKIEIECFNISGSNIIVESISGRVEFITRKNLSARYKLESFSGKINISANNKKLIKKSSGSYRTIEFESGTPPRSSIGIRTLSGNVDIRNLY